MIIHVEYISLTNFRNYRSLELELPTGLVFLVGANAQGKSNLLESLFVLATGHAHRTETDRDLVGWSAAREPIPYGRAAARVISATRGMSDVEVIMQIARRGGSLGQEEVPAPWAENRDPGPDELTGGVLQKAFKVNRVRQRAASAPGVLVVVFAGPDEVDLIGGTPARRRRFLDLPNVQTDPDYLNALTRYQRVLSQRNALLKRVREQGIGRPDEMDVWDAEFAATGSHVLMKRRAMLQTLQEEGREAHRSLTGSNATFVLDYRATIDLPDGASDEAEAHGRFLSALRDSWRRDTALGATSIGPHRDDLRVFLGDIDVGAFGSRGQQRIVALSLVLGQAAYVCRRTG
ncbi:MAG: AAA family ATPase, partial [Chloroflexi bacterium]|nr:AAA family ATPase [Chloroflexota bacterium]